MPIELNKSGYIGSISYNRQHVNIFGKNFDEIFIYIEKVADGIGSLTHSQSRGAESTSDASTTVYSIAGLFAFVKQYDKDFSPHPAPADSPLTLRQKLRPTQMSGAKIPNSPKKGSRSWRRWSGCSPRV